MKPPKCRLCSHEHWNSEPHVFKDVPNVPNIPNACSTPSAKTSKVSTSPAPVVVEKTPVTDATKSGTASAAGRSSAWKKANPERYREYQKELMRARRASN